MNKHLNCFSFKKKKNTVFVFQKIILFSKILQIEEGKGMLKSVDV